MRSNSTLEKAVKFINNCKFIFSFKKNILQKNVYQFLFFLITTISFAQTGSCTATLIVENDGNTRSTPLEGTYYSMLLTNNGNTADTYTLHSKNTNDACSNPDGSATSANVTIGTAFIDAERNTISEISLNAGQSVNFYIHITIPAGISIQKWSCNQVTATSKNCTNYAVNTVLHTLIINPVNE